MGLDMYLNMRRSLADYSHAKDQQPVAKAVIAAAQLDGIAETDNMVSVTVTAIYWRKVNGIHQWFVDNVQGGIDECQESEVSREQLAKLLDVCKTVAADFTKAPDLLPTQDGFFFGSTQYDEWYREDVKRTITKLEQLLAIDEFGYQSFTYQSSW